MSGDFIEKIVFLLATAVVSGLLIPVIVKIVTARIEESRKRVESSRIRDQAITNAQAKLLEEFSEVALTYETLALDVSWFGCLETENTDMQKKAFERYNERVVGLHTKWRTLLIRSRLLASEQTYKKMNDLFEDTLLLQDTPIVRQFNDSATNEQWNMQHQTSQRVLATTNEMILRMAEDMNLTKSDLHTG